MDFDFTGLINQIGSLNDSIKESFTVLRDFLLDVQLSALSLSFILLFLAFLVIVLAVISSPAFFYELWQKQKKTLAKFVKGDNVKRNWIGKS